MCSSSGMHFLCATHSKPQQIDKLKLKLKLASNIYFIFKEPPVLLSVSLSVCFVCVFAFTWSPCMCICGRVEDECHFHATSAGNNLAPSFHSAAAAARYFFYSLLSGCFTRFARLSLLVAVAATATATPATVTGIVLLLLLLFKLLLFSIFTTIFMCWNC